MKDYQNPEVLNNLYWKEGLSQIKIAKMFGVSRNIISYFMKKYNILRRHKNKRRLDITNEMLSDLYLKKNLSIPKITELLGASSLTIWRKMKKYGIKVRPRSGRPIKNHKTSFSGDLKEKAYMLGLRTGDLYAKKNGKQIQVVTGTTRPSQLKMFQKIFEKYSKIYIRLNKERKYWHIECLLDKSFSFLIQKPKKIPRWILKNISCFYAFLAGYSDCEASWTIWKPKNMKKALAKFQLSTCDRKILCQIKNELKGLAFKPSFGLLRKKGQPTNLGKYNQNIYFLYLNRQKDILRIAKILLKLSKHDEKIWKMKFIIENLGKEWENIKDELFQFKKLVKETTLNKSSTQQQQSLQRAMITLV